MPAQKDSIPAESADRDSPIHGCPVAAPTVLPQEELLASSGVVKEKHQHNFHRLR